ncbi:Aste57867_1241 [Aphanomyces stellatus]|uniref:Aste57867_1241 protein n=1 Tax=Aphanomyces stellatus TaxID=120398 RepID=A0A485K8X1_9STRA|nr:hypothetical protein As57867_001240 [Aphanomyces stellatus]VFT78460.1 Aste57867_1241 [Aphanomyces stellatus]
MTAPPDAGNMASAFNHFELVVAKQGVNTIGLAHANTQMEEPEILHVGVPAQVMFGIAISATCSSRGDAKGGMATNNNTCDGKIDFDGLHGSLDSYSNVKEKEGLPSPLAADEPRPPPAKVMSAKSLKTISTPSKRVISVKSMARFEQLGIDPTPDVAGIMNPGMVVENCEAVSGQSAPVDKFDNQDDVVSLGCAEMGEEVIALLASELADIMAAYDAATATNNGPKQVDIGRDTKLTCDRTTPGKFHGRCFAATTKPRHAKHRTSWLKKGSNKLRCLVKKLPVRRNRLVEVLPLEQPRRAFISKLSSLFGKKAVVAPGVNPPLASTPKNEGPTTSP